MEVIELLFGMEGKSDDNFFPPNVVVPTRSGIVVQILCFRFPCSEERGTAFNYDVANGSSWTDPHILRFSDGFSCDYRYTINDLADCYMEYFGFDHADGFNAPPERSVIDLQHIFSFVQKYTGCDLINEPNSKCKGKPMSGSWRPYIDPNEDSSEIDGFPNQIPPYPGVKAHLKLKSKRNSVTISYEEDAGENQSFDLDGLFPGDDGPDFPLPLTSRNTFKVEKRGQINPTLKIEINGYNGASRVLLILTGKSKLWFRVHCYGCGAWVEVKSNCKESVIKYSVRKEFHSSEDSSSLDKSSDSSSSARFEHHDSSHETIHVPLHHKNGCTLWKAKKKPKFIKKLKARVTQKVKKKAEVIKRTKTAEPSEITTTTKVKLREPERKTFIDWILPPGSRREVQKISPVKHS